MSFSDRQIRILRSRLRAYRVESGKKERGRKFSWNLIAILINQTLGLDFDVGGRDGDRLGKFVDGEPKKTGSKERRSIIPETRRLQAIRDYLMLPNVQYLAAYEMEDDPELPVAARAFAEFLADDSRTGNTPPGANVSSQQLGGTYECAREENTLLRNYRLSLNPLGDGLFEAEEITEYFDTRQALSDFSEWRQPERYRRRRSRSRCTGWAAKNKYDCLYLFLKDEADATFSSYIAAAHDNQSDDKGAIQWLYLQKYGPLGYFSVSFLNPLLKQDFIFDAVSHNLKEKYLALFQRVESSDVR